MTLFYQHGKSKKNSQSQIMIMRDRRRLRCPFVHVHVCSRRQDQGRRITNAPKNRLAHFGVHLALLLDVLKVIPLHFLCGAFFAHWACRSPDEQLLFPLLHALYEAQQVPPRKPTPSTSVPIAGTFTACVRWIS
jgi:hypothetical protein